ncbi:MAG: hypothetical protein EP343_04600 [Deltaproteobacteria bacterium]|nr:MAG: hypothetical protein EP343_04600 [Deltaproteobacteria bacterium]
MATDWRHTSGWPGWLLGWWVVVGLVSLYPSTAEAWRWGQWKLNLQLRYATGWDDNVQRLAIPPEPDAVVRWDRLATTPPIQTRLPSATITHDGVHQFSGQVRVRFRKGPHVWNARYALGGKIFYLSSGENALVQSGGTSYYARLHRRVYLGVSVDAKDRRRINTSREYSYLGGLFRLLWFAPLGFRLTVQGGYNVFQYRHFEDFRPDSAFDTFTDGQRFSFHGDLYNITLQKSFGRVFRLYAGYQLTRRFYSVRRNRNARPQDQQGQPTSEIPANCSLDGADPNNFLICSVEQGRADLAHRFTLGFRLLYRVLLEGAYNLQFLTADSYGESFLGHNIQLTFAATPFWKLYLVVQLRLQFRNYFDGAPFGPNRVQTSLDDNLTSLTIRLSRPIWKAFHVNLRYSHYANLFGLGINQYSRNLLTAGFSFAF